jgi:hypothetical protein
MHYRFNEEGMNSQLIHTCEKVVSRERFVFPALVSSGVRRGARVTLSIFHFNSAKLS